MNLLKFTLLFYAFAAPLSSINENAVPLEKEATFDEFLNLFPKVDLPFTVDFVAISENFRKEQKAGTVNNYYKKGGKRFKMKSHQEIMMQYIEQVEHQSFSRMGPIPHTAVAQVQLDDDHIGVIFAKETIFPRYYITTFSKKGEEISTKYIAGFSRNVSLTCTVESDKSIEVKKYKNLWLKDLKKGLEDNEVIGYDLQEVKVCSIDTKGEFVETITESSTDRASLD